MYYWVSQNELSKMVKYEATSNILSPFGTDFIKFNHTEQEYYVTKLKQKSLKKRV